MERNIGRIGKNPFLKKISEERYVQSDKYVESLKYNIGEFFDENYTVATDNSWCSCPTGFYSGIIKDGKPQGQGVFRLKKEEWDVGYRGEWDKGMPDGKGANYCYGKKQNEGDYVYGSFMCGISYKYTETEPFKLKSINVTMYNKEEGVVNLVDDLYIGQVFNTCHGIGILLDKYNGMIKIGEFDSGVFKTGIIYKNDEILIIQEGKIVKKDSEIIEFRQAIEQKIEELEKEAQRVKEAREINNKQEEINGWQKEDPKKANDKLEKDIEGLKQKWQETKNLISLMLLQIEEKKSSLVTGEMLDVRSEKLKAYVAQKKKVKRSVLQRSNNF